MIPADEPGTESNPNFKTPNAIDEGSDGEDGQAVKAAVQSSPSAVAAVKAKGNHVSEAIELSDLAGRKESNVLTTESSFR